MSFTSILLDRYVQQETLPHALLFIGSDIEALEEISKGFITQILEQKGASEELLDKTRAGSNPDLCICAPFSKSAVFTIEQIKEICSKSQLYPHESPHQFFILKYADRMQDAACNALLKTLEEPSSFSCFILLAQKEEELAKTLKSRMQVVVFDQKQEDFTASEAYKQLHQLLALWPKISFNNLHIACQKIHEEVEQNAQALEGLSQTLRLKKEGEHLFLEVEKWFYGLEKPPFSLRKFDKIFEEAKIGFQRSIKLSICLESLLLQFI